MTQNIANRYRNYDFLDGFMNVAIRVLQKRDEFAGRIDT